MDTLKDKIDKHNKNIKTQFGLAEQGKVICLTDMMISKETIDEEIHTVNRAAEGK